MPDGVVARGQLHDCSRAISGVRREMRGTTGFSLGRAEKEFPWRVQKNLATSLNQGSPPLPLTDQAAGGERRDIGGLRQLLIRDIQLHALGDLASNALGQVDEDGSKPLRRCVAGERHMR